MGSNVYKNTIARIKFEQTTPSTEWVVVHNLGTECPIVDVYTLQEGSYKKLLPAVVERIDENAVQLTFTVPTAGYAMVM